MNTVIEVNPSALISLGNSAINHSQEIDKNASTLSRCIADTARAWESAEAVIYTAKITAQNERVKRLAATMGSFGNMLVNMGNEWQTELDNQNQASRALAD